MRFCMPRCIFSPLRFPAFIKDWHFKFRRSGNLFIKKAHPWTSFKDRLSYTCGTTLFGAKHPLFTECHYIPGPLTLTVASQLLKSDLFSRPFPFTLPSEAHLPWHSVRIPPPRTLCETAYMVQLPLQWFKAMIAMETRNVKYKISLFHTLLLIWFVIVFCKLTLLRLFGHGNFFSFFTLTIA